jgi:hypothetical protein
MNDKNKLQKYEKPTAVSLRDVTPSFGVCSTGGTDGGGGLCTVGNNANSNVASACAMGNSATGFGQISCAVGNSAQSVAQDACGVGNTPVRFG